MANWTMGLVTTQTRVFELKTPSNAIELNKMQNVAVKQWKEDNPAAAMTDDSITVSVSDDAVRMFWPLTGNFCPACGHPQGKHQSTGCLAPDPEDEGTYCVCELPNGRIGVG